MIYYDIERTDRPTGYFEDAWFNCAKCGKEVRESEWASLCNDCGEDEERQDQDADFASCPHPSAYYERTEQ